MITVLHQPFCTINFNAHIFDVVPTELKFLIFIEVRKLLLKTFLLIYGKCLCTFKTLQDTSLDDRCEIFAFFYTHKRAFMKRLGFRFRLMHMSYSVANFISRMFFYRTDQTYIIIIIIGGILCHFLVPLPFLLFEVFHFNSVNK